MCPEIFKNNLFVKWSREHGSDRLLVRLWKHFQDFWTGEAFIQFQEVGVLVCILSPEVLDSKIVVPIGYLAWIHPRRLEIGILQKPVSGRLWKWCQNSIFGDYLLQHRWVVRNLLNTYLNTGIKLLRWCDVQPGDKTPWPSPSLSLPPQLRWPSYESSGGRSHWTCWWEVCRSLSPHLRRQRHRVSQPRR